MNLAEVASPRVETTHAMFLVRIGQASAFVELRVLSSCEDRNAPLFSQRNLSNEYHPPSSVSLATEDVKSHTNTECEAQELRIEEDSISSSSSATSSSSSSSSSSPSSVVPPDSVRAIVATSAISDSLPEPSTEDESESLVVVDVVQDSLIVLTSSPTKPDDMCMQDVLESQSQELDEDEPATQPICVQEDTDLLNESRTVVEHASSVSEIPVPRFSDSQPPLDHQENIQATSENFVDNTIDETISHFEISPLLSAKESDSLLSAPENVSSRELVTLKSVVLGDHVSSLLDQASLTENDVEISIIPREEPIVFEEDSTGVDVVDDDNHNANPFEFSEDSSALVDEQQQAGCEHDSLPPLFESSQENMSTIKTERTASSLPQQEQSSVLPVFHDSSDLETVLHLQFSCFFLPNLSTLNTEPINFVSSSSMSVSSV